MIQLNKLLRQGREFEKNKSLDDRKAKGVFYTPIEVVDYMIKETIGSLDFVKNPYIKIIDISCGVGYFLIRYYETLFDLYSKSYEEIIALNPELKEKLNRDNIGQFIVENNLWGVDIDEEAVVMVRDALDKAAGCKCKSNIICADSLLDYLENTENSEFWNHQYDCVIGNPPYIGHKGVSLDYKSKLYLYYKDVYKDKSDISYCFFKRGIDLLKPAGILSFITSRYFMEGPSAENLRGFLAENDLKELVDFGDCKVFADAGVAVAIITLQKQQSSQSLKIRKFNSNTEITGIINIDQIKPFYMEKSFLNNEGWLLIEPEVLEVFKIIHVSSTHELRDLLDSYQGIITGCDKAFVMTEHQASELNIEKDLLKPWIKNSNVEKFEIKSSDKVLIYSDLIENPADYPEAIAFTKLQRDKLTKRRECQRGVRQWYQLQWGRNKDIFESEKLVYPYKAASNRFAVDRNGLYCSADVYSLVLKEKFKSIYTLDYIAALLNSKLTEFYFKCIAKKISPTLFDYYPNKVLKIKLNLKEYNKVIEELVKNLYKTQNAAERKCILQAIDREIYKMYNLNESQIMIIENSAGE